MEKKKYTNIGTMMAKKADANNPDAPKGYYLKLEQQTKKDGTAYGDQIFPITLANGKVLNSGDILNLYSKKDKFSKAVEEGKMDQEKADFLSSFLLFDIVLTESADETPNKSSGPNF